MTYNSDDMTANQGQVNSDDMTANQEQANSCPFCFNAQIVPGLPEEQILGEADGAL